jgi:hypothetical protein
MKHATKRICEPLLDTAPTYLSSMVDFHVSNDPRHWLGRAERARHVAASMADPELKKMMLEVATGYERLAKRAEERRQRLSSLGGLRPRDPR